MTNANLTPTAHAMRVAIVDLIHHRESRLRAPCKRTRAGSHALIFPRDVPLADLLTGYDDDGWHTWIELQQIIAHALSGEGGHETIEAAAANLGLVYAPPPRPLPEPDQFDLDTDHLEAHLDSDRPEA